ncbi:MAG: hypothetical protein AAF563_12570 [Pseudomonadota bacterium]
MKLTTVLRLPSLAAGLVLSVVIHAHAEPIPPAWLEQDYASCIAAGDTAFMRQYCKCVIEEIRVTMTRQEYLAVTAAVLEQKSAGASDLEIVASNKKMSDAAQLCLQQTAQ